MKKLGMVLLVLFLMPVMAAAENFNFAVDNWQASRDEIKAMYKSKPVRDNEFLTYNIPPVLGLEAQVNYKFDREGQLTLFSYRLYCPPSKAIIHIENYDTVKANLKAVYGRPSSDNIYWFADKEAPEAGREIGTALAAQTVRFQTLWELPDVKLELDMKGQGGEVVIAVRFIKDAR